MRPNDAPSAGVSSLAITSVPSPPAAAAGMSRGNQGDESDGERKSSWAAGDAKDGDSGPRGDAAEWSSALGPFDSLCWRDGPPVGQHADLAVPRPDGADEDYAWTYRIFDERSIHAAYLVRFREPEDETSIPRCAMCELEAVVYCSNDDCFFCLSCDALFHDSNPVLRKHERTAIRRPGEDAGDEADVGLGPSLAPSKCPKHKDVKVEFFCPECFVPVCLHCKMTGDHSRGPNQEHQLVAISEAYESAVRSARQTDPEDEGQLQTIRRNLDAVLARKYEIVENRDVVAARIERIAAQAIAELDKVCGRKTDALGDEEQELSRQRAELLWVNSFLRRQQRMLTPVDFLDLWATQLRVRKRETRKRDAVGVGDGEMASSHVASSSAMVLEDIFPDMGVEGQLTIVDIFQNERR